MVFKVGDICRVNEEYSGHSTLEVQVVGSVVEVVKVTPPHFSHLQPQVHAKVLFGAFSCTAAAYVFYENELELITQELSND